MSNTEQMVSVPRELLERAKQFTFDLLWPGKLRDDLQAVLAQPADQHQGEPVAFEERVCAIAADVQGIQRLLEDLADKRWPDKDHDLTGGYVAANIGHASAGAKFHLPALSRAIVGLNELLHMQADAGEVERLREQVAKQACVFCNDSGNLMAENEKLRTQLAERDALLQSASKLGKSIWKRGLQMGGEQYPNAHNCIDLAQRIDAALSASAEPSVPVERDERAEFDPLEWLETEISAVDAWYRGSPSYEHDAGWMKDQALRLVAEARAALERKP